MTDELRDDTGASRYELHVDGVLAAFEDYTLGPGRVSFDHTEVVDGFEGTGAASRLAGLVLDEARAAGRSVLPVCPFIASFIAKHPEKYLDLVPADRRSGFGL